MKKYRVSFDLDIYAEDASTAFNSARLLVSQVRVPRGVLDAVPLPTGGAQGKPHTETELGWKCNFHIEEAD